MNAATRLATAKYARPGKWAGMTRAVCIGLLLMVVENANAEVKASLDYLYYLADANTGGSLSAILRHSTPPGMGGNFGWTSWHVDWHYQWHFNANGACRITATTIDLTSTVTLPRLVNGSSTQAKSMNTFLEALRVHELGHVSIGTRAADAIDRALIDLPQMADCQVLDSEAKRVAQRTLDEWREAEKRYDSETGHGKSQGAFLTD
jgi:predicted secreted Zn-dependent protease